MFENCPEKCRCRLDNQNIPLWVDVSCSEANLSSLPEILPPNSAYLNVSHNQVRTRIFYFSGTFWRIISQPFFFFQIKTLEPIRTNRHYQHLRKLTANDNELSSMSDLTGSNFMRNNPLVLNLQYNKIKVVSISFWVLNWKFWFMNLVKHCNVYPHPHIYQIITSHISHFPHLHKTCSI